MKCVCRHLLTRHAGFGRCEAKRSTPGGRVYRCDCLAFRSKKVDALQAMAARLARFECWLERFEAEVALIPVGLEDPVKGAGVFNWRVSILREVRAALEEP